MTSKRGMSEVVGTVLIIMLTIMAVALIAGFMIPMINKWMNESKECFEARDKISIELGKFTYYNDTNTLVMIKRSSSEFKMKGILISLNLGDGSSESYKIYNYASLEGVKMYSGSTNLTIPDASEAKTYVFSVSSDFVRIAPILENERICDEISEAIVRKWRARDRSG